MAKPLDATLGLVVPIDVVAFCVGNTDPARTAKFSGATVNYNLFLNSDAPAFMGGNVTRGFQFTMDALEPGVHLHWALPDALTRADGGTLDFPTVPNRWLVTRIVVAGNTLTPTSFIVESDTLQESSSASGALVIPVKPVNLTADAAPVSFEYLGQTIALDDYAGERPNLRALADGTGFELTAVSNGVPSFAAYYPEGRNSFGFYDPVAQLPASATLLYVVTGWYQSASHDPAARVHGTFDRNGKSLTLTDTHDWACEGSESYTLYSGSVQHVVWSATSNYVPDNPVAIHADAALANTPSEALAAWFANSMNLGGVLPEQLLTAFQQGLWDRLSQPTAPILAQLREGLHDSQFRKIDSGLIHSIRQQLNGTEQEAIGLPLGIAQGLDTLNLAAAQLLEVNNQIDTLRWQVFADWYRYFASAGDPNGAAEQSAIFTHFGQTLMPLWDGDPGLKQARDAADAALQSARAAIDALLDKRADLILREEPGPRYFGPNDPALMLRADALAKPLRYGGDNSFHVSGKLQSRPTDALVSAVAVGGTPRTAADYAGVTALPGAKLPYAADCSALLAEAILLDADVAAGWSGQSWTVLEAALGQLLDGAGQTVWSITTGTAPSPVAVNLWTTNPWLPLFLTWDVGFAALQPTIVGNNLQAYAPGFFTGNFTVDPQAGSFLSYTPSGPNGISIDPKAADYSHVYRQGWTMLSARPAQNFRSQITDYLKTHDDKTLANIGIALDKSVFLVQPLADFSNRLLNRNPLMQVSVVVTPGMGSTDVQITQATADVLTGGNGLATYHVTPVFNDPFNPIRAGWLSMASLNLVVVDAFGQRRPIEIDTSYVAASMAAQPPGGGAPEPGYAYAAPRIAQASRLLFQWLSAADNATAEYNQHPAESPICGWLLPNHLTNGFFFYDAAGRPLGSLFPAGSDVVGVRKIVWQGAPGNDRDIDSGLLGDPVVAAAHPELRALILHLGTVMKVPEFGAFYSAVDNAHVGINPGNLATDAGLTVLVGRPVAVVQAGLTLDLQGPPFLDQNSVCMRDDDGPNPYWEDSDAGLSGVQFPVVVGDIDDLDDGLVGYFIGQSQGAYNLGTFYSEAAAPGAKGAVVQPTQQTLLVTPTPAADSATPTPATPLRLLMLVDPRAPVHAVTGLLPTQSLLVPPDLASAAMSTLEISLQITPVLRAIGGLALPAITEPGFELAYLEQRMASGAKRWFTLPEISASVAKAMWSYTPQSLAEGWLRLNPALIAAALLNGNDQPIATGGQTQAMTLRIANRKRSPIAFSAGTPAPEGTPPNGSIFYIHFETLVAQADVAAIGLSADGWTFTPESDGIYGRYFAVTRATPFTLGASGSTTDPDSFDIAVTGLKAVTGIVQANVHLDYYGLDGASDGVATAAVTVTQTAARQLMEVVK